MPAHRRSSVCGVFSVFSFDPYAQPSPVAFLPSHRLMPILLNRKDKTIRLNMQDVTKLDEELVSGFHDWVQAAPDHWKLDGFLTNSSPIVVTSCFGQNAAIGLEGEEDVEAAAWDRDRDFSKIAFLTVAIATSIEYETFLMSERPSPQFADHFVMRSKVPGDSQMGSHRPSDLEESEPRWLL